MLAHPSPGYSLTIRARYQNQVGMLGAITSRLGVAGGDISAIDIVETGGGFITRDITINVRDSAHGLACVEAVQSISGLRVINVSDRVFLLHLGGKLEITARVPVKTRDDLMMAYVPGAGRVSTAIKEDPDKVFTLTVKRNMVAIVSDGSSVPGLGNIGPVAAIPVIEGKAVLLKEFAGVDAFPVCLNARNPEEIISAIRAIAPVFGAIDLEDLAEQIPFDIEEKLQAELDIPVFQGLYDGTSIVVLAALINAARLISTTLDAMKVVLEGDGPAVLACSRLLTGIGIRNLTVVGTGDGASAAAATAGADAFVGVCGQGTLTLDDVRKMRSDPIVFLLDDYGPNLDLDELQQVASIVATGRMDYPNQLNSVIAFPGLFRGLLDSRASAVSESMKQAAARTIADIVNSQDLHEEYIVPGVFDKRIVPAVARAVALEAEHCGLARRQARPTHGQA